jgi:hypothetical protein
MSCLLRLLPTALYSWSLLDLQTSISSSRKIGGSLGIDKGFYKSCSTPVEGKILYVRFVRTS